MLRWLFWWRPPALLRAVIVNLVDEETAFKGVLWSSRGAWLTIRGASMLKPQGPPTTLDGEVVLRRERVLFIQVLP